MKKNDEFTLTITGMTSEGAGVGRKDGMAVFVNGAAEGDRVVAHVIKAAKNYSVAVIKELLEPSPDRVDADCGAFPSCGGCVYRHISYEAEKRVKRQRVQDALTRLGGICVEVSPVVSDGRVCGYRNKAQYPVANGADGLRIGFYAAHSHRIVEHGLCPLQPSVFKKITDVLREYSRKFGVRAFDPKTGDGILRHIYIRRAEATGDIMVCAVAAHMPPHCGELTDMLRDTLGDRLKTVAINYNSDDTNVILSERCETVFGDGYIYDELCGVKVRLSPLSFYQVNRPMAERLYAKAAEFAGSGGTLLDLYCGAGTIGLSMAARFDRLIGVEIVPEAVEDAKWAALQNGAANAEFICDDAAGAAKALRKLGIKPDTVIVDPPRKGLGEGLPRFIAEEFAPERIVYVSCDPSTLARDCAELEKCGYPVREAVPFDLFPRTKHVECAVLLTK